MQAYSTDMRRRNSLSATTRPATNPAFLSEDASTSAMPHYMRELAMSRVNRHSRASSIVSTTTKFSTTTTGEDARSIDLLVGGQYFRINRDGSRITQSELAPPPYDAYFDHVGTDEGRPSTVRSSSEGQIRDDLATPTQLRNVRHVIDGDDDSHDDIDEIIGEGAVTPRQRSPIRNDTRTMMRATISDPTQLDMPSPIEGNGDNSSLMVGDSETPARNLSYKEGPEILDIAPAARKPRGSDAQSGMREDVQRRWVVPPLRRRNGVRLPSLDTHLDLTGRYTNTPQRRPGARKGKTQSAGPVMTHRETDIEPQSPDFIGPSARGIFPTFPLVATSPRHTSNSDGDSSDEIVRPLAMDTENDISLHYASMMRRLDRDHRKQLHLRDKELAQLRERLNEMDLVYRQQLRARDFIVDDLKARLAHLESAIEIRIEKARYQVEDMWESRWKDRDRHLRERMRRIEEEAQKAVEDARAEATLAQADDEEGDEEL
jgi:hypothetical protein